MTANATWGIRHRIVRREKMSDGTIELVISTFGVPVHYTLYPVGDKFTLEPGNEMDDLFQPSLPPTNIPPDPPTITLWQMALTFLKLGAIGFGGGVAVIALMEQECVQRQHCLETEEFLHGVGLGQILGPFAVNTAIFIGYRRFGLSGALLAEVAFLAPSVSLVILLSWLYFTFHQIPSLQGVLAGLGPVVIALIISAAWSMGRKSVRSPVAMGLFLAACLGSLAKISPVWLLAIAGIIGFLLKLGHPNSKQPANPEKPHLMLTLPILMQVLPHRLLAIAQTGSEVTTVGLLPLTAIFLKVGLVFFGGGFALIPILNQQLVTDLGWLTHQEFIDGVAISQLTPGPIAVLATFAGYRVANIAGSLTATVALFLPATVLMLFVSHYYQRLRNVKQVKDFLAGINPAVVGLILTAAITLTPTALHWTHPASLLLFAVSLVLLIPWKWHPAFVLTIGALTGMLAPTSWI